MYLSLSVMATASSNSTGGGFLAAGAASTRAVEKVGAAVRIGLVVMITFSSILTASVVSVIVGDCADGVRKEL
jgi:hypothetical protein